jgi:hypothetical protein
MSFYLFLRRFRGVVSTASNPSIPATALTIGGVPITIGGVYITIGS